MFGPRRVVNDGNVRGDHVRQDAEEIQRVAARQPLGPPAAEVEARSDHAGAIDGVAFLDGAANRVRGEDDAESLRIDSAGRDPRVAAGQDAGRGAELGIAGHDLQGLALRHVLGRLKILDDAGDADRHPPGFEQGDAADAASPAAERLPKSLPADADGADDADAGDDHVSEGHCRRLPLLFQLPPLDDLIATRRQAPQLLRDHAFFGDRGGLEFPGEDAELLLAMAASPDFFLSLATGHVGTPQQDS